MDLRHRPTTALPAAGGNRRFSALDRAACLERLSRTTTGRVAFTAADGVVTVLPVTYAMDGDAVLLRTSAGSELEQRAREGALTFQVDEADVLRRTGWSVMVVGRTRVSPQPEDRTGVADALAPWAPGLKDVYIRISTDRVSGRAVEPTDEVDVDDLRTSGTVPPHRVWSVASRSWATPFDGR